MAKKKKSRTNEFMGRTIYTLAFTMERFCCTLGTPSTNKTVYVCVSKGLSQLSKLALKLLSSSQ